MGVDLVVIVENSKNISLQAFKTAILQESVLGSLVWNSFGGYEGDEIAPWEEFAWEGKTYFSWRFPPRLSTFNVYELPEEPDDLDAREITFLKIAWLLEQLAGGPVHIGNDVVNPSHPGDVDEQREDPFWLPLTLDSQLKNWRAIAQCGAEPSVLF